MQAKANGKKAFEEARRLREMKPVGVMTWDPRDLRFVHKPGGGSLGLRINPRLLRAPMHPLQKEIPDITGPAEP